eukprot:jgi/Bigna1/74091/fgenesh1_pg.27_\
MYAGICTRSVRSAKPAAAAVVRAIAATSSKSSMAWRSYSQQSRRLLTSALLQTRRHHRGIATIVGKGKPGTSDFKMETVENESGKQISAWHDIPLFCEGEGLNMVVEIPKYTKAKMEINTKLELNPIVQGETMLTSTTIDTKKGVLRDYHGPIFWNYGALPQTWEDPNEKGGEEVGYCCGDNDPLDVVEIGSEAMNPTQHIDPSYGVNPACEVVVIIFDFVTKIPVANQPLGVLAMIDSGELDWKVLAISLEDPLASDLNDVADIKRLLPNTIAGIREWFRWYKTPDGKPLNTFGYDEIVQDAAFTQEVILHTHQSWKGLIQGEREPGENWIGFN